MKNTQAKEVGRAKAVSGARFAKDTPGGQPKVRVLLDY